MIRERWRTSIVLPSDEIYHEIDVQNLMIPSDKTYGTHKASLSQSK